MVTQDLVCDFSTVRALDHVNLEVCRGEIFGLLGHNGAGKTTLIRQINGLLRPTAGSVRTFGLDPTTDGYQVRARTGVLTEYPALDVFLSPLENLLVYAQIHGIHHATARQRAITLLDRLGLDPDKGTAPARNLSAGLKQRVALARALVHEPEMLLLDEPTSNLDPLAARGVRDLAHQLSRDEGRTIILSTHNLSEAQELCDRVAVLENGRLLAIGTHRELSRQTSTSAVHITTGSPDEADRTVALLTTTAIDVDGATALTDGVTVTFTVDHAHIPTIVNLLVADDIDVHAVRPQTPTLEDVYVALHHAPAGAHA